MNSMLITSVAVQKGEGQDTLSPHDILISNGVIQEIAAPGKLSSYQADIKIDGSGKTVMPGMVFSHTHIAYDSVEAARDVLFKHPLPKLTLIAAKAAKRAAQLGYTTMIGAGSVCKIDIYLKDAIDQGLFDGPQFFTCSRDIMAAGPMGRRSKEKVAHIPADYMPVLTEEEEVEDAVHKEIDDGAEILKTFATGDDHFPNANSNEELFSLSELTRMVKIARQRNVLIRCHARGLIGIKNAIKAGVDIIDHATYADQEALDDILEQGISIVPSFYQPLQYLAEGEKYGSHPEQTNFDLEVENTRNFLPLAEEMGINIAVGDDFGFVWTPHGTYHQELIAYQEKMNIHPKTIIKWATHNGAKMIRQDKRIGKVEEGYQADLILLGADPAQDIRVLTDRIEQVFIKGKEVDLVH